MTIKVFYHKALSTDSVKYAIPTEKKAAEFVKRLGWEEDIIYHGLVKNYRGFSDYAITETWGHLERVHYSGFLQRAHPGWGNKFNALAHSVILFEAVYHANNVGIAFAPVSGFHHAGYDYNWGFCTYNGLAAAALWLNDQGRRVLILDGDQHEGDGTLDILEHLGRGNGIVNHSVQAWDDIPSFEGFDHILYQAGADAHILDGGYLDDDNWVKRDRLVFERAKAHNIPITVIFAGGYSGLNKVVELHLSTYWTATEVYHGSKYCNEVRQEIEGLGGEVSGDISARARLEIYGELTGGGESGQRPSFRRYAQPGVSEQAA